MRQRRGLGGGKTVSLDRVTLTSRRMGLAGRPDWLLEADGEIIVEEGKSTRRGWPSHRAQMGCYFLLIDVHYGLPFRKVSLEGEEHGCERESGKLPRRWPPNDHRELRHGDCNEDHRPCQPRRWQLHVG
jgi:hypothetical protein